MIDDSCICFVCQTTRHQVRYARSIPLNPEEEDSSLIRSDSTFSYVADPNKEYVEMLSNQYGELDLEIPYV